MKLLIQKLIVLPLLWVAQFCFGQLPIIDGTFDPSEGYIEIAASQGGFGFDNYSNLDKVYYRPDGINGDLYLFIECGLADVDDPNNDILPPDTPIDVVNGLGLWLDFSELASAPGGTSLGINEQGEGRLHYLNGAAGTTIGDNIDFKAYCDVDYLIAVNTGETATDAFFDVVRRPSTNSSGYDFQENFAQCDQIGTIVSNGSGAVWPSNGVMSIAFNNSKPYNGGTGIEMRIPYDQFVDLNSTMVTSAGFLTVFAVIVSSTGEFSELTAPTGPVTVQGYDIDYTSILGGPTCSQLNILPLQSIQLSGSKSENNHKLTWNKASKESLGLFTVYESLDGIDFTPIHPHFSNNQDEYQFEATLEGNLSKYYKVSERTANNEELYSQIIKLDGFTFSDLNCTFLNNSKDLIIQANEQKQIEEVSIVNSIGKTVFEQTEINSNQFSKQLTQLKSGVYIISIQLKENNGSAERKTEKIIVF